MVLEHRATHAALRGVRRSRVLHIDGACVCRVLKADSHQATIFLMSDTITCVCSHRSLMSDAITCTWCGIRASSDKCCSSRRSAPSSCPYRQRSTAAILSVRVRVRATSCFDIHVVYRYLIEWDTISYSKLFIIYVTRDATLCLP